MATVSGNVEIFPPAGGGNVINSFMGGSSGNEVLWDVFITISCQSLGRFGEGGSTPNTSVLCDLLDLYGVLDKRDLGLA